MSAEVSSIHREFEAARAVPPMAEGRARVLQFGPGLEVRGGVSAVEQIICDHLLPYAAIRHVPTMRDGSAISKASAFTQAVHAMRKALAAPDPAIFHIHFASRGSTFRKLILASMVQRAGRPLVLHAHGGSFDRFHAGLPGALRRRINACLQRATVFIVLSQRWREFFIETCELSPSQVTVLPNPVRWNPEIPDRAGRRQVQFLALGRIAEYKGSFDLLKAFIALPPPLRARARVVMAGDGDLEGARRLAAPLGDAVRVLSWVGPAERDRLLAASDVFVLPSHAEGLPMALLESMAAGLPSIVTPVGGIPDIFTNGSDGLFVGAGRVGEITAAMTRMVNEEGERLAAGRRAHARVRALDVQAYARRLGEIYQRIAPVAGVREIA
jgi:glycosyltransferase involved in cell wall biosynthesis